MVKLIFIVLGLNLSIYLLFNCSGNQQPVSPPQIQHQKVFNPPFLNLETNFAEYNIDAAKDTFITTQKGTVIEIPSSAFCDKNGKIISGEVQVRFREFSDALDIYLAGIPMQYDSAGIETVFETAGMVEINAFYSNQPVFVNPGKQIKINMLHFENSNRYNVYYFDSLAGKWVYMGKDTVKKVSKKEQLRKLPEVPAPPAKATDNAFKVSDPTGQFPELAMYKNVLFEPVDGKACGFPGTEIKIEPLSDGKYRAIFIFEAYGMQRRDTCICYLAFKEGADYSNAMETYRKKYKHLIEKNRIEKDRLNRQWENYFHIRYQYGSLGLLDLFYKKEVTKLKDDEKIIRTLKLNRFGLINIDSPTSYPAGADLTARFTDKNGNDLALKQVVLVEKGRNALFRYTNRIRFNPSAQNLLWGLTPEGYPAVFYPADFQKINKTTGDYTFRMTVVKTRPETYEDVVKIIINPMY